MYGVSEKEEYIAEQAFQLKIRNITLCFLACIVVLTLFVVWRLWHFNHIVEYKNRMLARLINEKFANRKDGNQLSEVYEQLAVVSEIEPNVFHPKNWKNLLTIQIKKVGKKKRIRRYFRH